MANYVDVIWGLLFSNDEQQKFDQDPDGYLAAKGIADSSPEQIREAVVMACERGPVAAATSAGTAPAHTVMVPPPPPADHSPTLQETVQYYVTEVNQNYTIDDRDTYVDNSTEINAGDDAAITIDSDTNIVGDDGILVDGDNSGNIVTGDENVVDADGNAFGDGAVAADGDIDGTVNTGEFDGTQTRDNTNVGGVGEDASGIGLVEEVNVGDDLNIGGEQDNSSDDSTHVDVNMDPDGVADTDGGNGLPMGQMALSDDALREAQMADDQDDAEFDM